MPKRRITHAPIVVRFAERLRELRVAKRLTQRQLADLSHVTLSYISRLEAGGAAPGLDLMERIAEALQVPLADLLPSTAPDVKSRRAALQQRFEQLVEQADGETLALLDSLLRRLA